MQRNKKLWPIHMKRKQSTEIASEDAQMLNLSKTSITMNKFKTEGNHT